MNRAPAKASTEVKVGDRVETYIERPRVLEVVTVLEKRVGAPIAAKSFIDHSPPAPVVKRDASVLRREAGAGRPTKRERREIERLRGR